MVSVRDAAAIASRKEVYSLWRQVQHRIRHPPSKEKNQGTNANTQKNQDGLKESGVFDFI